MKYLNLFKLQYMVILILGCLFISSCTEEDMTVGTVDEKIYEFHDELLGYLTDDQGKQLCLRSIMPEILLRMNCFPGHK